jgi:hypothetical protein
MQRIFLGLAVTVGMLLASTFVLGLVAGLEDRVHAHFWHDLHFLIGLVTTMATLLVHAIVCTYLLGTGKWVKEVVRVYRLPGWLEGIAVRNKRRAFPFELGGMLLIGATACLGAAVDTRRDISSLWHLAAAAVAIGFQLGAFLAEYVAIVAQARLLLEVKDCADAEIGMRNAGCGTETS